MTVKKVPIRRCVGCGEGKPKKELVRIVRTSGGEVLLDETGRTAGRGAYLCHNPECLNRAKKKKSLERAFECSVPQEVFDRLTSELEKERGNGG